MGSIKVCRICLVTEVKMDLIQGALESNIKAVFGHNVTENKIKCLDRKALNLESAMSPHTLFEYHWPHFEEVKVEQLSLDIILDMTVEEDAGVIEETSDCPDDDLPLSLSVKQYQGKKRKKHSFKTTKKKRLKTTKESAIGDQHVGKVDTKNQNTLKYEHDMLKSFEVTNLTLQEQLAEVEKRRDSSNYRDSPYKCDVCFKGFLQAETLKNHTVRHDAGSGDSECEVCKCRFATRRALAPHAAGHARRFSCKECEFTTVHSDQAKKHKLWHDGVTYKCQYCNEVSTKLTSYLSHMRMKHTSEFVCEVCGYSFVSGKGLKMHKSRMHKDLNKDQNVIEKCDSDKSDETDLYCNECELQFVTREAWKRHTVTSAKHRVNLGHGCRHCGETFPSAASLRAHRRRHAGPPPPARPRPRPRAPAPARARAPAPARLRYPATCEHCEEVIPNRSRHWKHYQRCHQDKKYPLSESNYICEICGKGFQANAFLVYHKRTHFEERACKCPHCPKAFYNRANLHVHIKTHSQHRPHACSLCSKNFKTKLGLQQHFKSHRGARPYPCQYSGEGLPRAACRAPASRRSHR